MLGERLGLPTAAGAGARPRVLRDGDRGAWAVNGIWHVQTQHFGVDQFHSDPCFSVKFFFYFYPLHGKVLGAAGPPPKLAKGASRPEAALQALAWCWCSLGSRQASAESCQHPRDRGVLLWCPWCSLGHGFMRSFWKVAAAEVGSRCRGGKGRARRRLNPLPEQGRRPGGARQPIKGSLRIRNQPQPDEPVCFSRPPRANPWHRSRAGVPRGQAGTPEPPLPREILALGMPEVGRCDGDEPVEFLLCPAGPLGDELG